MDIPGQYLPISMSASWVPCMILYDLHIGCDKGVFAIRLSPNPMYYDCSPHSSMSVFGVEHHLSGMPII
jgi:hypothetical protein